VEKKKRRRYYYIENVWQRRTRGRGGEKGGEGEDGKPVGEVGGLLASYGKKKEKKAKRGHDCKGEKGEKKKEKNSPKIGQTVQKGRANIVFTERETQTEKGGEKRVISGRAPGSKKKSENGPPNRKGSATNLKEKECNTYERGKKYFQRKKGRDSSSPRKKEGGRGDSR